MSTDRAVSATSTNRPRHLRYAYTAVLVALASVMPMSVVQAADPPKTGKPTPTIQPTPGESSKGNATNSAEPSSEERIEAMIAAARAYIDIPYRLGTEGPTTIDCSGLVFRAFANAGELRQIGGSRLRAAGYLRWFAAHELLTTDAEQAERGDLVVYNNGEHIGIYLGEGRVISAVASGVTVHALDGISVAPTGFLAVDWTGKRGPFKPGSMVLPTVEAEEPVALVPTAAWVPTLTEEAALGPAVVGEERPDMRTANSRTFEEADGRFTTEIFSRPIHFLPEGSTDWQPIDLRFHDPEPDTDVAAVADAAPVALSLRDTDAEGALLTVAFGDLAVGLSPVRESDTASSPEFDVEGRYADYRDLLGPGIGLRVFPRADGFKAFLVLTEAPESRSLAFDLDTADLTLASELDGSVTMRDAAGAVVARIPRPMLLDSSDIEGDGGGVRPSAVTLRLGETEQGATRLTLAIDRASLAEAVYPAYVDLGVVDFPTSATSALHSFASSTHAGANFSTYQRPEAPGYAEMWHGRRPDRRDDNEAYLRFPGIAELLNGLNVESASLAALPYWQGGRTGTASWLGRITEEWDVRTLTWNARPAAELTPSTVDTSQGEWSAIDVSAHVQEVVAGLTPDYGFVLHANGAGRGHWKRFVAESAANASLEPRLVVHWSGLRPSAAAVTDVIGSSVALMWATSSLAPIPSRVQVQVSRDAFDSIVSQFRLKGDAASAGSLDLATADLDPGTYAWRVRAKFGDDMAWSSWSEAGTFVVTDPTENRFHQPESGLTGGI
ncbi:MAG: DNRLRE domain-containing protein [Chloroflexota bacterium]